MTKKRMDCGCVVVGVRFVRVVRRGIYMVDLLGMVN